MKNAAKPTICIQNFNRSNRRGSCYLPRVVAGSVICVTQGQRASSSVGNPCLVPASTRTSYFLFVSKPGHRNNTSTTKVKSTGLVHIANLMPTSQFDHYLFYINVSTQISCLPCMLSNIMFILHAVRYHVYIAC